MEGDYFRRRAARLVRRPFEHTSAAPAQVGMVFEARASGPCPAWHHIATSRFFLNLAVSRRTDVGHSDGERSILRRCRDRRRVRNVTAIHTLRLDVLCHTTHAAEDDPELRATPRSVQKPRLQVHVSVRRFRSGARVCVSGSIFLA